MGKGILMEVEGRNGVVLTPKGEFKRVPLPKGALEVGDEIEFQERTGLRLNWVVAAAAAILLAVLSPVGYEQWALAQPAALVQIDINPSIELTLNGRQQVIRAEGLNADGQLVLNGLSLKGLTVDEATRGITAQAVAVGMLDPFADSSAVVVAVAPRGTGRLTEEGASEIASKSKTAVQAEVQHQAQAKGSEPKTQVAAIEATKEEVQLAQEQGITLPKLIILQEVKESYPEVTVEAINQQGPGKFVQSLGLNAGELFSQVEKKHNRGREVLPASGRSNSDDDDDDDRDDKNNENDDSPGRDDKQSQKLQQQDAKEQKKQEQEQEKANKAEQKQNKPGSKEESDKEEDDSKDSSRSQNRPNAQSAPKSFFDTLKEQLGIGRSSGAQQEESNSREKDREQDREKREKDREKDSDEDDSSESGGRNNGRGNNQTNRPDNDRDDDKDKNRRGNGQEKNGSRANEGKDEKKDD